jgi:hypothetical protein
MAVKLFTMLQSFHILTDVEKACGKSHNITLEKSEYSSITVN